MWPAGVSGVCIIEVGPLTCAYVAAVVVEYLNVGLQVRLAASEMKLAVGYENLYVGVCSIIPPPVYI